MINIVQAMFIITLHINNLKSCSMMALLTTKEIWFQNVRVNKESTMKPWWVKYLLNTFLQLRQAFTHANRNELSIISLLIYMLLETVSHCRKRSKFRILILIPYLFIYF